MCCYDNLTDYLSKADIAVIEDYVARATGSYPRYGAYNVLSEWSYAKRALMEKVFKSGLRISTHVCADLSEDESYVRKSIINASITLVSGVVEHMYRREYDHLCDYEDAEKVVSLFDPKVLVSGMVDGQIRLHRTADNRDITVGGKVMRAIRRALEFYEYPDMQLFEQFRDRVSLILTNKKIDADVVLSIHPIDFLSMSDNSCGWSSCMSLLNNGTASSSVTEMMNSPSAIVAYVESKDRFMKGVPNKSWRQLIFCDVPTHTILSSRQYPYVSDALAKAAISAVAQRIDGISYDSGNIVRYPETELEAEALTCLDNSDIRGCTKAYANIGLEHFGGVVPYATGKCNDFLMFNDDVFYKYKAGDSLKGRFKLSGLSTCLCCGKILTDDAERVDVNRETCKECEEEGPQSEACNPL